jgi:hypothetical protein
MMVKFVSASLTHGFLRASGVAYASLSIRVSVRQQGHRRRLEINLANGGKYFWYRLSKICLTRKTSGNKKPPSKRGKGGGNTTCPSPRKIEQNQPAEIKSDNNQKRCICVSLKKGKGRGVMEDKCRSQKV